MSTKNVLPNVLVLSRTNYVTFSDVNNSTEAIWKAFGMWYQGKREASAMTQEDVAEAADMHVKTVSRIENGEPTKRATVIQLAKAIGVDENEALRHTIFSTEKLSIETFEPLEGVRISFDEKKIPKREQDKILDLIKVLAVGVKATESGQ